MYSLDALKMDETIYVISDIHLQNGVNAKYATNPDNILSLIKHINTSTNESLIVAGDFFDLWHIYNWNHTYEAHTELIETFFDGVESGKIKYLTGNHDRGIVKELENSYSGPRNIYKVTENITDTFSSENIVAEHGNLSDITCIGIGEALAQAGNMFFSLLEEIGLKETVSPVKGHNYELHQLKSLMLKGSISYADAYSSYVKRGLELLEKDESDIYIYGHTHTPGILKYSSETGKLKEEVTNHGSKVEIDGNKIVINSGAQSYEKDDIVVIEKDCVYLEHLKDLVSTF